jgi:hypothetical protein
MTKIEERKKKAAADQIEESLRRLQTDHGPSAISRGHSRYGSGRASRKAVDGSRVEAKDKASCATSDSPATRPDIHRRCWRPPSLTASPSTPCRCR